jgi:hypothetical protein
MARKNSEGREVAIIITAAVGLGGGKIAAPSNEPITVKESFAKDLIRRGRAKLAEGDVDEDLGDLTDEHIAEAIRSLPADAFGARGPKIDSVRVALDADADELTSDDLKEVWSQMQAEGFTPPAAV